MAQTIEESAAQLEAASAKAQTASNQLHDFANGGPTETVETDAGTIPTLAKFVADKSADIDSQIGQLEEDVSDSLATADDAAKGAGQVGYDDGNAYAPGTAGRALNVGYEVNGIAGFRDRGAWVALRQYEPNDFYTFAGTVYFVVVSHLSLTVEDDFSAGRTFVKTTDFVGASDPAAFAKPYNTWADTGNLLRKRRNGSGTAWVVEGRLFARTLDIVDQADLPTTDEGPLYSPGQGTMEFLGGAYAPTGGGAKGGGGNQAFYENDKIITQDYTITAGKNAMTAGPVEVADGVTVTIPDGSTWTII